MSFGAFVNGAMQGASFVQDLQDKYQKGKLRQFEIEKEEEAARLRKESKDIDKQAADSVKYAAQGVAGDGMGPPESAAGAAPEAGASADIVPPPTATPGIVAQEGVAPAPAVGLPAGQVGPGEMRPSAIEAAGATQPAAAGTMPTATMPTTVIKPKEVKKTENFHEARMRIAQERGNSELLGKYTKEYATHLIDQSVVASKKFEAEQRPLLEEMARIKTQDEWDALPVERRNKMLKAQQEVADNSARAGATGWQLVQNPLTRNEGMTLLGHAFGEDKPLKDIQREGDFFIPIGADGKQLVGQDGKPVRVHKDAAERMVSQYGSKAPGIVLAEGAQLRNPNTGALIAENTKDLKPNHEQSTSLAREAGNYVDRALGVQRDQMGNLIAGVTPEQVKASAEVQMRAAALIRAGKTPDVAAQMALEEYKKKPGAPAAPGAAPAAAAKPVETKKYGF
jgi:hypothetical protein